LIYFGDLRQVMRPVMTRLRPRGTLAFTVERAGEGEFGLTDSGRYVHSEAHVRNAAADAGLTVVSLEREIIRYEYGDPVEGLVAVCQAL
jgi:predicted TPR repeat methyltransferase